MTYTTHTHPTNAGTGARADAQGPSPPFASLPYRLNGEGEPYIPLLSGSTSQNRQEEAKEEEERLDFRLTGWKEGDLEDAAALYNHPLIGRWSMRRPFPYTTAHAGYILSALPVHADYFELLINTATATGSGGDSGPPSSEKVMNEHLHGKQKETRLFSLSVLRETSSGRLVGDCTIWPAQSPLAKVADTGAGAGAKGESKGNDAAEPSESEEDKVSQDQQSKQEEDGDEGAKAEAAAEDQQGLVWEIAYNLSPEYWGKGLGTGMVNGVIGYARWLGVKRMIGFCEKANVGSSALLRKCGFKHFWEGEVEWPEDKGGGKRLISGYQLGL